MTRVDHRSGKTISLLNYLMLSLSLTACGAQNTESNRADASETHSKAKIEQALIHTSSSRSLVVLGDSVAAGEGINYDYTYDPDSIFGARWVGGKQDPVWQGSYQDCHQSELAYSEIISQELGMRLSKFACTGSTYNNGMVAERVDKTIVYRPAQFGHWLTQKDLNTEYDKAKPDLVIVTLGADDIDFVGIVTYCVLGSVHQDIAQLEEDLAKFEKPRDFIKESLASYYPTLMAFTDRKSNTAETQSPVCTAANPGKMIERLFWEPVNSGKLSSRYVELVAAIQERGRRAGKVPKIVFTTYHNPLPQADESIDCHDTFDLNRNNIDYLNSLLIKLDSTIVDAVKDLPGVKVADLSNVLDGHRWCSEEPWAYGMSVLWRNFKSKAPFHPTPSGQRAIADVVMKHLTKVSKD